MDSPTNIRRAKRDKDHPYFMLARSTAQDEALSWEARGLLAYLLSKPDDWIVNVKDLQQGCGRDKVKSILAELEKSGYLTRETEQPHGTRGRFMRYHYEVHETPFTEKPSTVEPSTANPSLTEYREEQKTDQTLAPQVTQEKKPRPRNELFDAIALGSFGLSDVPASKGGRIGKLTRNVVAILYGEDVVPTPEQKTQLAADLAAMYVWYAKMHPELTAPASEITICKYLNEWRGMTRPTPLIVERVLSYEESTNYHPELT